MTQTQHTEVRTVTDLDHVRVIATGDWTHEQWVAEAEKALGTQVTGGAWTYQVDPGGSEVWTFCKVGCSQEMLHECVERRLRADAH